MDRIIPSQTERSLDMHGSSHDGCIATYHDAWERVQIKSRKIVRVRTTYNPSWESQFSRQDRGVTGSCGLAFLSPKSLAMFLEPLKCQSSRATPLYDYFEHPARRT